MRSKCAACLKIHDSLTAQCSCGSRRLVAMPDKRPEHTRPSPRPRPAVVAPQPEDVSPNHFYGLPLLGRITG